jgi:hypothetical protein
MLTTGVALLRGIHVASALSLFGTLMFLIFVAPQGTAESVIQASILGWAVGLAPTGQ